MMKVRIKTFDNKALKYETEKACGFDFKALDDTTIKSGEFGLIETGTVIETPEGYALQIQPRSSTFKKHGLIQTNSVGLIDRDYCGDNDTIKFPYYNIGKEDVFIKGGTRIGQGVFLKIGVADFEVVQSMQNGERGGFGTTGD